MKSIYVYWIGDLSDAYTQPTRYSTGNQREAEAALKNMLRPYKQKGDTWEWEDPTFYNTFTLDVLHIRRHNKYLPVVGVLKTVP